MNYKIILPVCLMVLGVLYLLGKKLLERYSAKDTGFPTLPKWEREKLSPGFKEFKNLVIKSGDKKMLDLAAVARDYMIQLSKAFDHQKVTTESLQNEWGSFKQRMGDRDVFDRYQNMRGKLFLMDVNHIVRHLWEHQDSDGVIKNGNDLRKAYSLLYENDLVRTPAEVFHDLTLRG